MKKSIYYALLFFILFTGLSFAKDVQVRGYTKSDGTYVAPHHRSSPDNSINNNWSTKGNVNPYTGQEGTRNPSPSYNSNPFGQTNDSFNKNSGYSNPYGNTLQDNNSNRNRNKSWLDD